MTATVPVLTYHSVGRGPPPLCLDPALFEAHLDCIVEAGIVALTVGDLARALRAGELPERSAAITFDDGFASVMSEAAPRMVERGLRGTVFCVAGRLGATNDWPSQPEGVPRRALAGAAELAELARAGFEIGSHGTEHTPLDGASTGAILEREVAASRRTLEDAIGVGVSSFAYPYATVAAPARTAVEDVYSAACAGGLSLAEPRSDPYRIPRIDAHYLRRPELLLRVLQGSGRGYLGARRLGARARRVLRRDYVRPLEADR